jgi:hypothetical protein
MEVKSLLKGKLYVTYNQAIRSLAKTDSDEAIKLAGELIEKAADLGEILIEFDHKGTMIITENMDLEEQ